MTRRLLLRVKSKLVQWQIAALSSRAGKSCKVELAMADFNSGRVWKLRYDSWPEVLGRF